MSTEILRVNDISRQKSKSTMTDRMEEMMTWAQVKKEEK
jgi:hypothetical protein